MIERKQRRARPSMEGLEGRALLNGSKNHAVHALAVGGTVTASSANQFHYTAADGAKVKVRLTGPGNLLGTALDSSGNLNLVFADTSIFTQIIGTVKGGSGRAALGTIRSSTIALNSPNGVGGTLIGRISLPDFDLVSGGTVNLLAGVNELSLNSVAANSQMRLRDTPLNTTLGISTTVDPLTGAGLGYAGNQPYRDTSIQGVSITTTGVNTTGGSTTTTTSTQALDPTIAGFGGANVGAINGAIPIIPTVGNGQNFRGTPGLSQSQVSFGRTLAYAFGSTPANANAIRLTSAGGTFAPGPNLIEPRDISLPINGGRVAPPGVILDIKHVNGVTATGAAPLGNPNIYGFDPATNRLIRFDAATGQVLNVITVPGSTGTTGLGGVALARNGTELVVLVGVGSSVQAYDALSGVFVGQFTTRRPVGGIATSGGATILLDPGTTGTGIAQTINVAGSLAVGSTVTIGEPFTPPREFTYGGGATGVPGTANFYALGSGFFDSAQPDAMQAGIETLTASSAGALAEASRAVLTSQGLPIPAMTGVITNNASRALGSIESSLALDAGIFNGQNTIVLLNPSTLAAQARVNFNYANPLSDLSESFHPEIAGTALIDVQGNIQSFRAQTVNGLVLNDAGNLNLFQARTATNSSIVGLPFGHVAIKNRSNVSILTSSRIVGERGDVTVVGGARQVGPLTLP